jgi:ribosomal protein L15
LAALCEAGVLTREKTLTLALLQEKRIVKRSCEGIRVIGCGVLPVPLTLDVAGLSTAARAAVERAGGKVL